MLTLGIDIGGSATKAIAADEAGRLSMPVKARPKTQEAAADVILAKFLKMNPKIRMRDISRIVVTGVGAPRTKDSIHGIPCVHANEYECSGRGGLYLSGLDRAVVASMGTGTAVILAEPNEKYSHVAGTGVGAGTMEGLSSLLFSVSSGRKIARLAGKGDLRNVDKKIGDVRMLPNDPDAALTMANFGNLKHKPAREDLAAGVVNLVLETVGTVSALAAVSHHVRDIVVIGGIAKLPQAEATLETVGRLYDVHFMIPENPQFGTAIGAARMH